MTGLGTLAAKAAALRVKMAADDSLLTDLGSTATIGGGLSAGIGYGGAALGDRHLGRLRGAIRPPVPESGLGGVAGQLRRGMANLAALVKGRGPSGPPPGFPTNAREWAMAGSHHGPQVGRAGLWSMAAGLPIWLIGKHLDTSRARDALARLAAQRPTPPVPQSMSAVGSMQGAVEGMKQLRGQ
jgi:hypothetical protein